MNHKRLATAFGLPLVAAVVLAGGSPALASGGGGVIETGKCSAASDWKLKVKKDNGRLEVEYEVDSNQNGQTWAVLITDNGQTVFEGEKVTRGRSGSFEARARPANQPGTDNFVATAENTASGETCTGELTFTR